MSMGSRRYGEWKPWIALLCCLCVLFIGAMFFRQPTSFVMPDGSVLIFRGVTYGTNAFIDRDPIGRFVSKRAFPGGLRILGQRIYPPQPYLPFRGGSVPPLTAWFYVRGTAQVPLRSKWQFVASNLKGRQLVCSGPSVRAASSNEVLFSVPLDVFPRDSKEIFLSAQFTDLSRVSVTSPLFKLKNPSPISVPDWKSEPFPATNHLADFTLVLSEALVSSRTPRTSPFDILVRVRFHPPETSAVGASGLTERPLNSQPVWQVLGCEISDCEGNTRESPIRRSEPNATEFDFIQSLEMDRTWKIRAVAAQTGGAFNSNQIVHVQLGTTLSVNVTNKLGSVFNCSFDGKTITVGKSGPWTLTDRLHLKIVSAVDHSGAPIEISNPEASVRWQSSYQTMSWRLTTAVPGIEFDLIEPKTIVAEFFVRPGAK